MNNNSQVQSQLEEGWREVTYINWTADKPRLEIGALDAATMASLHLVPNETDLATWLTPA